MRLRLKTSLLPASPKVSVNQNQTYKLIQLSLSESQLGIKVIRFIGQYLEVTGGSASIAHLRKLRRVLSRAPAARRSREDRGGRIVMKIVWRSPNGVTRKSVSIVNIGRVEAEDLVQLFYRYSSGLGILVTDFELLVNRTGPRRAA